MTSVGGPNTRITNLRWRTAAIWEKSKNRHISTTVGPIDTKFGTVAQFEPRDHSVSKIEAKQLHLLTGLGLCDWCLVFIFKNIRCTEWQNSLLQSGNKTANMYVKTPVYTHC